MHFPCEATSVKEPVGKWVRFCQNILNTQGGGGGGDSPPHLLWSCWWLVYWFNARKMKKTEKCLNEYRLWLSSLDEWSRSWWCVTVFFSCCRLEIVQFVSLNRFSRGQVLFLYPSQIFNGRIFPHGWLLKGLSAWLDLPSTGFHAPGGEFVS